MPDRKVIFMGSKELGLSIVRIMVEQTTGGLERIITIDDSDDDRSKLDEFRELASTTNTPLSVVKNRKESETLIREAEPDLVMVVGWYWILPGDLIRSVPDGILGIHNSLLPRHRGGSPLVWTLLQGESQAGYSLFSFTEGMDEGPVWIQESIDVGPDEYIGEVLTRLQQKITSTFSRAYPQILDGTITPKPQEGIPDYCALRFPEDGLIDWKQPAQQVYNCIRAQSRPYPGAFSYWQGKKCILWKARLFEHRYLGNPGRVVRIAPGQVWVTCGDNRAVILEEMEIEGIVDTPDRWLRSLRERLGE